MIDDKGKNLVFLFSMPRSGSTLLSMMLGSHPAICCPPEPWIVLTVAECLGLGHVGSMIYGREWAGIASIEFLLNAERKQKGVVGKIIRVVGEASQMKSVDAARHILEKAYQTHLNVSEKSVFVDKTPRYYMILDLIDNLFPESRKIILLRNPLDIYSSFKRTWGTSRSIFTTQGVSDHTRDFCEGLFKISDYAEAKKDLICIVRYEDLILDNADVLRRICRYLDLEFSSNMMAYDKNTDLLEAYRKSPVGDPFEYERSAAGNLQTVNAWHRRLEKEEIQSLIDVAGADIFERLGYSDTINDLRNMRINIPSEQETHETRTLLMKSLAENVKEQPFSAWDRFVSSLKYASSDDNPDILKQKLNAANAQLAKIYSGNSWIITKPLRFLRRHFPVNHARHLIKKLTDSIINVFRKHQK